MAKVPNYVITIVIVIVLIFNRIAHAAAKTNERETYYSVGEYWILVFNNFLFCWMERMELILPSNY